MEEFSRSTSEFKSSFENLSYLAGLDWRVSSDVMLYMKTSRGFKAGGQNQRGGAAGGFQPFKPETVTDYEIGVKSEWLDNRLRVNVAAYRADYKDIQRNVNVLNPSGQITNAFQNAASGKIDGVELELAARPLASLTLRASGNYMHARYSRYVNLATGTDLSANRFLNVPKWQYSLSATHVAGLAFGTLTTNLDYSYQSSVDLAPDNRSAFSDGVAVQRGYGLLNGRVALDLEGHGLELSVWAKNLTDKRYLAGAVDLTGSFGYGFHYLAAPRTYGVGLSKKF